MIFIEELLIETIDLKNFELKTPEIILRNEKRMLQEAVDALIDISRKKEQITIGQRKVT
jgi:DNA-directed RNA polymerase beta' subunit